MAEAKQRKEDQPAAGDDIDWANVASEAAAMVELNKAANDAWGSQGDRQPRDP